VAATVEFQEFVINEPRFSPLEQSGN